MEKLLILGSPVDLVCITQEIQISVEVRKKKICRKTICDDVVSLIIHPPCEGQVPVVQSLVSLTSSLRGQLVKCFMIL